MMEMSVITMKLFPFISKDLLKKEKSIFLHKINNHIHKNKIKEEVDEEENYFDIDEKPKTLITAPRIYFSEKDTKNILSIKPTPKNVSVYYSLKETPLKVPQSFRVNVKNNYMMFKDSGGEKQNYFKFSSRFGYNSTDELGIIKKFFKKYFKIYF
jgi:hypothetical protein